MGRGGRRTTSFKPGQSGNPRGRPRGVKESLPRGLLKAIVMGLVTEKQQELRRTLEKNLTDQDRVMRLLELAAKLNKEIGLEATTAPTTVMIHYHGPLDPKKFRAKTERHLREERDQEEAGMVEAQQASSRQPKAWNRRWAAAGGAGRPGRRARRREARRNHEEPVLETG